MVVEATDAFIEIGDLIVWWVNWVGLMAYRAKFGFYYIPTLKIFFYFIFK